MALTVKLQFGDNLAKRYTNEYNVVSSKSNFSRSYNHSRPEGDARCNYIELTLVAPDMKDMNLYDWYINQGEQNCRLLYTFSSFKSDESEQEKEILLENALCFGITEEYSVEKTTRRLLKLRIVAEEVNVNGVLFNL
jgi:hypothetical protein